MPIGLSKVTVGFPRVGINCAMCHAASFRASPDDIPTVYPAAASHQTGEQEYLRFLIACASDPRFTPGTILARDREEHAACRSSTACSTGSPSSRARGARFCACATGRMDDQPARLGARPHRSLQPGEVRHPSPAGGRHDWQLRHDAAVEPGAPGRHRLSLGRASTSLREVVQSSALGDGASRRWVERDYAKWNETDPTADVEPAPRDELHRRTAGAEVSAASRCDAGGRGRHGVPRRTAPSATSRVAAGRGR